MEAVLAAKDLSWKQEKAAGKQYKTSAEEWILLEFKPGEKSEDLQKSITYNFTGENGRSKTEGKICQALWAQLGIQSTD